MISLGGGREEPHGAGECTTSGLLLCRLHPWCSLSCSLQASWPSGLLASWCCVLNVTGMSSQISTSQVSLGCTGRMHGLSTHLTVSGSACWVALHLPGCHCFLGATSHASPATGRARCLDPQHQWIEAIFGNWVSSEEIELGSYKGKHGPKNTPPWA